MEEILKYFPNLTETQRAQFEQLMPLYVEWNEKINVISRKDIDNLYRHHVLHSLAIAKFTQFKPDAHILDLGTGGGFPGIPLAILFPETKFYLADSINKKITVVKAVAEALGLENVTAHHTRAEDIKEKFDFVVTRAVATFDQLARWSLRSLKKEQRHAYPNGIIALKGGNIKEELKLLPFRPYSEVQPIQKYFPYDFFEEKAVVYLQGH
jgi:16S rRNA (guanine527-N7)-methyltransferase